MNPQYNVNEIATQGPAVGDCVQFHGLGAHRVGRIVRVGPKNVTVAYISAAERKFAAEHGQAPHELRRAIRRTALKFVVVDSELVATWNVSKGSAYAADGAGTVSNTPKEVQ